MTADASVTGLQSMEAVGADESYDGQQLDRMLVGHSRMADAVRDASALGRTQVTPHR